MMHERITNLNVESLNPGIDEVLVAGNRGTCGGVRMAIESVNQVLDVVAGREKVYINWDIVNNRPISEEFARRGVVNVKNDLSLVPDGAIFLFSAHGVPQSFHEDADKRNLLTIDATCQLVERTHLLARRAARKGKHVFFIGDAHHPETVGLVGQLQPGEYTLLENAEAVEAVSLPEGESIVLSKTTYGASEILPIIKPLKERVGDTLEVPSKHDTCFATDNRQNSVRDLVEKVDALLVVGSKHSHNSQELRKIGEKKGLPAWSVDEPGEIDEDWFLNIKKLGLTSGASVIDQYTEAVIDFFRSKNTPVTYLPPVVEEDDRMFRLPIRDLNALRMRYNMDPIQL